MAHTHEIIDSDKSFVIDPITRTISNNSDKVKLVQFDHNSERFTFQCPRMIEGHDMSQSTSVRVQYINIDKKTKKTNTGVYEVDDLEVSSDDSNTVIFSWLISRNATELTGTLSFLIEFMCVEDDTTVSYAWHTDIYKYITVSTGMDNGEVIEEKYPDILEKWKDEILAEIPNAYPHPITKIESLDKTNMVILRNLDSGTYVLYGYFKPHEGSSSTMMFGSNILVSIVKKTSESHVQIFYPNNNCVQYVKITDTSYERKNIYLSDLADSVAEIGDLNDLSTEAKDKLVTAINEVSAYNHNIVNGKAANSLRTTSAAAEDDTYSLGVCAFAEGSGTTASGSVSHAEGNGTKAAGALSHAEGLGTTTTASATAAHAEGSSTTASGSQSHAEGNSTTASGWASHAEGGSTTASGTQSHAEGNSTTASGQYSHAEGSGTTASREASHAQGKYNIDTASMAHMVGNGTSSKKSNAHTLDWSGNAWFAGDVYVGSTSGTNKDAGSVKLAKESDVPTHLANGKNKTALRMKSAAEENDAYSLGENAFAEGSNTKAEGVHSHAEGYGSRAAAPFSHAEGNVAEATGRVSHAEGERTTASGEDSHAEGSSTTASSYASHAEGSQTTASGMVSHAEGVSTTASGKRSHAEGFETIASGENTHAQGKYNVDDSTMAHIVGNGTDTSKRSNAHTLDWSGNAWFAGDVYVGSTSGTNKDDGSKKLATEEYVDSQKFSGSYNDLTDKPTIPTNILNGKASGSLRTINAAAEDDTYSLGSDAFAEGNSTKASGRFAHAKGFGTTASGDCSYAEGLNSKAEGFYSHAEGSSCVASAGGSHAEGDLTNATGQSAHAEGFSTTASGVHSHAEGFGTTASGENSHAQGRYNIADSTMAHIVGNGTTYAEKDRSNAHTLDWSGNAWFAGDVYVGSTSGTNKDSGSEKLAKISEVPTFLKKSKGGSALRMESAAQESDTYTMGSTSFAEGDGTKATSYASHAEGYSTTASGAASHSEGYLTTAAGHYSHSEGQGTTTYNSYNHAEGYKTTAGQKDSNDNAYFHASHAEGYETVAEGTGSHAEGRKTKASFQASPSGLVGFSHAEGYGTTASGNGSHAEGESTTASSDAAHAEGYSTIASAWYSHAEGSSTNASGTRSHAEGEGTVASGSTSHAEGRNTIASGEVSHSQGKYNVDDSTMAHIVGNGSSNSKRSNAHTLDWSGNAWFAGDVYTGSTSGTNKDDGSKKLATEDYVNNAVSIEAPFAFTINRTENASDGTYTYSADKTFAEILEAAQTRIVIAKDYADNYYDLTFAPESTDIALLFQMRVTDIVADQYAKKVHYTINSDNTIICDELSINSLPAITTADVGKVLSISDSATPVWKTLDNKVAVDGTTIKFNDQGQLTLALSNANGVSF